MPLVYQNIPSDYNCTWTAKETEQHELQTTEPQQLFGQTVWKIRFWFWFYSQSHNCPFSESCLIFFFYFSAFSKPQHFGSAVITALWDDKFLLTNMWLASVLSVVRCSQQNARDKQATTNHPTKAPGFQHSVCTSEWEEGTLSHLRVLFFPPESDSVCQD